MPDALVTGASGFIGGAITRRLVAEGRSVRALIRDPAHSDPLTMLGAEPVIGDLTDPRSLAAACRGCTTVFHVAGLTGACRRRPGDLERVNVDGTIAVVRAAADTGVGRVVYTSSGATIGEASGTVGTEATPHRGRYLSAYERSKHLAERAATAESARLGVDLVSVNPSSVHGPGRSDGTARLLIRALRPGIRLGVRTRVSLVSIGDCVEAHLLAERVGRSGERYLISGWSATTDQVVRTLERVSGRALPVRWVPRWTVVPAASILGAAWALARRDAPICRETARTLVHGHTFDGSRAERELGLRYTEPEAWLAETVRWFAEQGLV
jgi:dihydroflavonol-4-reductase